MLQFRVPEEVYAELQAAATKKRLTMSQEAARRVELLPQYEKSHAEAKDVLEAAKKVTADNLPNYLREYKYQQVRTAAGSFWAEPGVPPDAVPKPSLDPDAVGAIEKAVEKAIEKVLEPAAEKIVERAIRKTKASGTKSARAAGR